MGAPKGSRSIFYAYQAALRNLADALDFYSEITATSETHSASLRIRADNLALSDERLLEAVEAGACVAECDEQRIRSDRRIAESTVGQVIPSPIAHRIQLPIGQDAANCFACRDVPSTH